MKFTALGSAAGGLAIALTAAAIPFAPVSTAQALTVQVNYQDGATTNTFNLDVISTSESIHDFYGFNTTDYNFVGGGAIGFGDLQAGSLNVFAVEGSDGLGVFSVYKSLAPFEVTTVVNANHNISVATLDDSPGHNDSYTGDGTFTFTAIQQVTNPSTGRTDGFALFADLGDTFQFASSTNDYGSVVFYTNGGFGEALSYTDDAANFNLAVIPTPAAVIPGVVMFGLMGLRRRRQASEAAGH